MAIRGKSSCRGPGSIRLFHGCQVSASRRCCCSTMFRHAAFPDLQGTLGEPPPFSALLKSPGKSVQVHHVNGIRIRLIPAWKSKTASQADETATIFTGKNKTPNRGVYDTLMFTHLCEIARIVMLTTRHTMKRRFSFASIPNIVSFSPPGCTLIPEPANTSSCFPLRRQNLRYQNSWTGSEWLDPRRRYK